MFQRKRRINDLVSRLKTLSTLVEHKTRELGEIVSSIKGVTFESLQAKELCDSILEIKKDIPEKKRSIQRIAKITASADALKQEAADVRKALLEKDKEVQAVYEKTGRIGYEAFKAREKEYLKYQSLFSALSRLDEKAEEFTRKNDAAFRSERSVLGKIVDAAKTIYSNQAYRANVAKYAKAYQAAGKKIVDSDFCKDAQDRGLDELAAQALEMEKQTAAYNDQWEVLRVKKEKLTAELASLGVKGSAFLRTRELENERKKLDALLVTRLEALGRAFADNPRILGKESAEASNLLREIKELVKESEKIKAEIKKIEAEIELESVKERIRKAALKIEQLERSILKSKDEIGVQEERIARLEKEKQKLEKLAGEKQNVS